MPRRSRWPCVAAVEAELDRLGLPYRVEVGRHVKFYVRDPSGAEHHYSVGKTTSTTNRGEENSRAGIRRLVKQLGLVAPEGARG